MVLRGHPIPDDEREARALRRTRAALGRHEKRRNRVMVALLDFPAGSGPMGDVLPVEALRALAQRGLAEQRWILTPEGRRRALQLKEGQS